MPVKSPYLISSVQKKISYTCGQIKNIQSKRLQTLRMFRAPHIFCRQEGNEEVISPGDGGSSPVMIREKESKPPLFEYPIISDDKVHLNSILSDPDAEDVISMSCFSRPMTRSQKQ
jgi:hypothetical protein